MGQLWKLNARITANRYLICLKIRELPLITLHLHRQIHFKLRDKGMKNICISQKYFYKGLQILFEDKTANVKNTPFVLPNRRNSAQTTATSRNLLYIQKICIYFCVRINSDAQLKSKSIMYVNDNHFDGWMEKLSKKLSEIGKDLKAFVNTNQVFDKDEKLLDNQDLCLTLHVSPRTLQRYRTEGGLPFLKRGQKIYYKAADVRDFVYSQGDYWKRKAFEDATKGGE
jgi:hypothetical protein